MSLLIAVTSGHAAAVGCVGDDTCIEGPGAAGAAGAADAAGSVSENSGSGGKTENERLSWEREPTFSKNDSKRAPLVGLVQFSTNRPSTAALLIEGGGEEWTLSSEETCTGHEQPILGLRPDTLYAVTVTASDGEEKLTAAPVEWRTPALPQDFPPLRTVRSDPTRMEPGMTLLSVRETGDLIVVDHAGRVRWYYRIDTELSYAFIILRNGHVLFNPAGRRALVEIDWQGHRMASWHAANYPEPVRFPSGSTPVNAETFHHSAFEMPNGNILTLSSEAREIPSFPSSASDPDMTEEARVVGDVIVEFSRQGELIKEIPLLDILDPTRVAHGVLGSHWDSVYPTAKDWSHSNAAVYDEASDAYLISVRHQDAVVKIDRETESLVWILGTHDNWGAAWQDRLLAPIDDDVQWPFHQHAVEITDAGIGIFDNGNYRAPAFEEPQKPYYSRAVRYFVDEEEMTVSQIWSFGTQSGANSFYSRYLSDADWLPQTGNTLITSGGLRSEETQQEPAYNYTRVREVTENREIVFELLVKAEPGNAPTDYSSYDAERIEDIRFLE